MFVMSKHILHCLGIEVDRLALCKTRMANNYNVHCAGIKNAFKVKNLGTKVVVDVFISYYLRETLAYGCKG